MDTKKLLKKYWWVAALVAVAIIGSFTKKEQPVSDINTQQEMTKKEWALMTYEEKSEFLNDIIKNKTLDDNDLKSKLRLLIQNECANPNTVHFTLQPSIYNGYANVVEADSAWIFTPFKCTAKNDFGVDKEIAGSVMFKYDAATERLIIHHWDMNQNN